MQRIIILLIAVFVPSFLALKGRSTDNVTCGPTVSTPAMVCSSLYREMRLEGVVNKEAFRQAVTGYLKIEGRKKDILTLIDFSKPSTEKRLYVFDMKKKTMLFLRSFPTARTAAGNTPRPFQTKTVR